MRILFVCENYVPHIGGAEIVFKTLAEELVQRGHTVDLVTHQIPGTQRFEVIGGVRVHRVSCLDSRYVFTFAALPRVLSLARKADIIHTTTFNGAPSAWLAARLLGKTCVLTVHEVWIGKWNKVTDKRRVSALIHNLLERMIYLLPFDHYACVSKHTRSCLIRNGISSQSSVVYNGVQYDHFTPRKAAKNKQYTFLCYGRPGASKGIDIAVRAFASVVQQVPVRMVLMLSKDSAYRKRYFALRRLVRTLRVEQSVQFVDPVLWKELPSVISSADCVVIPSLAEGFCFAAAETAALGVPIVATTAGSLPEVVSGKVVLVAPRDTVALARGMRDAYAGNYTNIPKKYFSIQENVEKYISIYQRLVPRGGR